MQSDDPLFANLTGTGWLHIKDNDVAEVFIFPDELKVPEQTENEWLNGVEGISGVVVTAEVSLLSFPEDGDLVTVTMTSSDGTALKLGSLESCASGGNARGDIAVSCMRPSAFVTFVCRYARPQQFWSLRGVAPSKPRYGQTSLLQSPF